MRIGRLFFFVAIFGCATAPLGAPVPGTTVSDALPEGFAWVVFGADTALAEIASLPEQRERGLMGRREVPWGHGMLFVFPESDIRSVWMKHTGIALDVVFFTEGLQAERIVSLEPFDETVVDSPGPTRLILETPAGWLAEHGIREGSRAKVVFPPGLAIR